MNGDGLRGLVAGVDSRVPLIDGRWVTAINFDNAATTPPLTTVLREIMNFSPWYSSVHRGTGYKSQLSSKVFDDSRKLVLNFVGGDERVNTVIYVKNTTEAINKLSNKMCGEEKKCVVLSSDMEHHSNDLPWRKNFRVDFIGIDSKGRLDLGDLEGKLKAYNGEVKLVTVTGASNVTGHINPVYKAAELAHRYGAKILVDGAQLVPHSSFDMKPEDSPEHIDFLVFSAHKMYAPFGIGVLIGPAEYFNHGDPDYSGGGTVKLVTHEYVKWDEAPMREEAGTQNLMGIVALLGAIKTLRKIGFEKIEEHEGELLKYATERLSRIKGVTIYGDYENYEEKVAILPFNIDGMYHGTLAKILSYEGGIAVRSGCFCAHPYIQKLLGISREEMKEYREDETLPKPGMVRVSFGLYNNKGEIDRLLKLLEYIVKNRDAYIRKYKKLNYNFDFHGMNLE